MHVFRRLSLLILVLLIGSLFYTGCGGSAGPDPNRVVGRWRMDFQWRAIYAVYCEFFSDHTFEDSDSFTGTWEIDGDNIIWTYTNGTEYTGTINAEGTAMSGTSLTTLGDTGDWSATRVYVTEADIIGSWTLSSEWGDYFAISITFDSDGTFTDSFSWSGTWTLMGDNTSWIYGTSPFAAYVGKVKVSGTEMFGTFSTATQNGRWYATKD